MKKQILKKTLLAVILSILCSQVICAQATDNFITAGFNSYYFSPQNIGISDPQPADFIRYGNLNINHYNGLLDMEIDLEGYKDKDFDLPMSIKYVSTGFTPSKRPSVVGHNWFLNFGGSITRTVKGSPDDTKGKNSKNIREYLKRYAGCNKKW